MSLTWNSSLESAIGQGLRRGLIKGGEIVRTKAVLDCPIKSGRLRNSIIKEVSETKVIIGTGVEYAESVEFGINQPAQPYLRPALLTKKNAVKAAIASEIRSAMR